MAHQTENLETMLLAAVPMEIWRLKEKGGPSDSDRQQAKEFGAELASKADVLMYGGKKGEAAQLFNRLAQAIAVLSFQPGGVRVFGNHWMSV